MSHGKTAVYWFIYKYIKYNEKHIEAYLNAFQPNNYKTAQKLV